MINAICTTIIFCIGIVCLAAVWIAKYKYSQTHINTLRANEVWIEDKAEEE